MCALHWRHGRGVLWPQVSFSSFKSEPRKRRKPYTHRKSPQPVPCVNSHAFSSQHVSLSRREHDLPSPFEHFREWFCQKSFHQASCSSAQIPTPCAPSLPDPYNTLFYLVTSQWKNKSLSKSNTSAQSWILSIRAVSSASDTSQGSDVTVTLSQWLTGTGSSSAHHAQPQTQAPETGWS